MKKLLSSLAVMLIMGTPAAAMSFGHGISLDNTITAEYAVEAEVFTANYNAELNYAFATDWRFYVSTDVDLQNIAFQGLDTGVEFTPEALTGLTFGVNVNFDPDFKYTETVVMVEVKF